MDVTDPTDLAFITDRPLPGDEAMYAQFQDEYAFIGSHKVDMRSFESVLNLNGATTVRPNDGGVGINTSQFALPIGNLLVTGGIGENQGMAVWAHQAAPDTRGPSVGFHIPRAGQTNYPRDLPISLLIHETLETKTLVNGSTFIVRPLGGNPIAGRLIFSFDDILTFTPDQPLAANTTYEVVLPAGGIQDAAGNGHGGHQLHVFNRRLGRRQPSARGVEPRGFAVSGGAGSERGFHRHRQRPAGLDGVHRYARQLRQNVGDLFDLHPIVLDVLARGEMAVAAIVPARDLRQLAQLRGRKHAVRNCDAQHRRIALNIEPVLQPQRLERIFIDLAAQITLRLVAKLRHAFLNDEAIDGVVAIHLRCGPGRWGPKAPETENGRPQRAEKECQP